MLYNLEGNVHEERKRIKVINFIFYRLTITLHQSDSVSSNTSIRSPLTNETSVSSLAL